MHARHYRGGTTKCVETYLLVRRGARSSDVEYGTFSVIYVTATVIHAKVERMEKDEKQVV